MTYEEAKMQIQAIPEKIWDQLSEPDREAMEMAFSALQAQDSPKPTAESVQNVQNEDLISRKAAIDGVKTLHEVAWKNWHEPTLSSSTVIDMIKDLPSAQPEPCVNTIDALNESIKHFDDMAEECRRNANIERNDYMDMRDDAAEYRQLSIWLNELKWIRERFQSQPEIIRCKDCKWCKDADGLMCKNPASWVVATDCDFGCVLAERRTNDQSK